VCACKCVCVCAGEEREASKRKENKWIGIFVKHLVYGTTYYDYDNDYDYDYEYLDGLWWHWFGYRLSVLVWFRFVWLLFCTFFRILFFFSFFFSFLWLLSQVIRSVCLWTKG